jgi:DNA-binding response OmpR family regulator
LIEEPALPASENSTEGIEAVLVPASKLDNITRIQEKKTILVVDDNDDIREILQRLLEYEDFKVFTAADGLSGFGVAVAEKPDLMIVDFNMPRLNGDQLIKMLRELPQFSATPIIVITAYGRWASGAALEAGADRVMTKPLDPDQVVQGIKELLDDQERPSI